MAEKTCPHGTPATSFCKRCERGEPAPEQATVARMSLGTPAAPAPPRSLVKALGERSSDPKPEKKRKSRKK